MTWHLWEFHNVPVAGRRIDNWLKQRVLTVFRQPENKTRNFICDNCIDPLHAVSSP